MNIFPFSFPRENGNAKTHLEPPDGACSAEFINNQGHLALARDGFLYVTWARTVFFIQAFFTLGSCDSPPRCVCNVLCTSHSTTQLSSYFSIPCCHHCLCLLREREKSQGGRHVEDTDGETLQNRELVEPTGSTELGLP